MRQDVTAFILAGGESRRMGRDKALIKIRGRTLVEHLAQELGLEFPVVLSCANADDYPGWQGRKIADRYKHAGPLGGIHTGLCECGTENVFAVSCDAPGVTAAFGRYLCGFLSGDMDVLLPVLRDGRECYAVAVYNRRALPVMERLLREKDYRLTEPLRELRVKHVHLDDTVFPDNMLDNLNTPEEAEAFLRRAAGPAVIAVSGVKNSGKTTLLEKLIPLLSKRGFRIGVIKHDGHDFNPDVEGTDTYRLLAAGAHSAGIFSATKAMLVQIGGGMDETVLARHFADMDVIFLEGFKHSAYPKIEVVRSVISTAPVCAPETLLAFATDLPLHTEGVPVCHPDDIRRLGEIVEEHIRKRRDE